MASSLRTAPDIGGFNAQDCQFIFECLKNLDDSRTVNLTNVGAVLGYTNTASVGNRFRAIRKRYGFTNLEATAKPANGSTVLSGPVPSTTPGQGKGNDSSAGIKKSMAKAEEPERPVIPDDSEAEVIIAAKGPKSKAKLSPKKGTRKGAKVTSPHIPATGVGASKGESPPQALPAVKAKVEDEIVQDEGIDVNLLSAVNNAIDDFRDSGFGAV
ncbi:hypothetical protein BDV23DRAFT_185522 [Aspergillus alliaceus]|uniref:Uncharacterized protein n=1 Tax=Petromyces alliaceus TaxID=209559 RepID=A0A5N7C2J4_PETAA|nr:hypothetical protein BDV23DRAFT_185522 [Aspergillus alliaceus]